MTAVAFNHVDVVFGDRPQDGLALLDQGLGREEVLERTGLIVGVRDATLDVNEGELCVLMGLSGSGKSTLLRCVNGLNRATRGTVTVDTGGDRVDVATCDEATLRALRQNRVAMVFQQFALLPWRTVRENVGFGLEVRGVSAAERARIVDEKLALVALDQWADKYAHELSGGMQQRVGLARAFATDAPILLMDEPFSALDPLIRDRLQDELLELQDRLHKTILFVSHDLDEAMKIGNRIAIMEGGVIVQYGGPEDIVLNPANKYVSDFVANMNPLNVLSAAALMTPVDRLTRDGTDVLLDGSGHDRIGLDDQGAPVSAMVKGRSVSVSETAMDAAVVTVAPDTRLRDIVELRRATGCPSVVVAEGRAVGVIGDAELFAGVLGRPLGGAGEGEKAAG